MSNDRLKNIYKLLSSDGVENLPPDYETFEKSIQTKPEVGAYMYDYLSKNYSQYQKSKTAEEFYQGIGATYATQKKNQKPTEVSTGTTQMPSNGGEAGVSEAQSTGFQWSDAGNEVIGIVSPEAPRQDELDALAEKQRKQREIQAKNEKIAYEDAKSYLFSQFNKDYYALDSEQIDEALTSAAQFTKLKHDIGLTEGMKQELVNQWKNQSKDKQSNEFYEGMVGNFRSEFLQEEQWLRFGGKGKEITKDDIVDIQAKYVDDAVLSPSQSKLYNAIKSGNKEEIDRLRETPDLYDPITGKYTDEPTDAAIDYEVAVSEKTKGYAQTPKDQLQDLFLRESGVYRQLEKQYNDLLTSQPTAPYGTQEWQQEVDNIAKYRDETKSKLLDQRKDLEAISRAFLLNEDPGKLDTGIGLERFTTALKTGLDDSGILGKIGIKELIDVLDGRGLNKTEQQKRFETLAKFNNIQLTEKQKEEFQDTFWEQMLDVTGQSIPAAIDIGLTEGLGIYFKLPALSKKLYLIIGKNYGKYAEVGARIFGNIAGTAAQYEFTGAGAAPGAGEAAGGMLIEKIFEPVIGKYGKTATILRKALGGNVGEFVGEYTGDFFSNLADNDINYEQVFSETFGRDFNEATDKALLTLAMTTLFGAGKNTQAVVKVFKQDTEIAKNEEAQKLIKAYEEKVVMGESIGKAREIVAKVDAGQEVTQEEADDAISKLKAAIESTDNEGVKQTLTDHIKKIEDAVQVKTTTEGVLREQGVRGEGELQGMEQQDQPEVVTEESQKQAEEVSKTIGDDKIPTVNGVLPKMKDAEFISDQDIEVAKNELIAAIDAVEASDMSDEQKRGALNIIESLYNQIDSYEFRTKTEAGDAKTKTTVSDTRKVAPNLSEQRWQGKSVEVDGEKGKVVITEDGFIVEKENGDVKQIDSTLLAGGKGEVTLDVDGNVESFTITTKDGTTVKVLDPDLSLDLAIKNRLNEVGEVPDVVFGEVFNEEAAPQQRYIKGEPESQLQPTTVNATQAPVAPVAPAAPVAPVAPSAPVTPVAPSAPVAPVTPAAPVAPVTPAAPVAPVTPAAPVAPVAPSAPVAPAAPVEGSGSIQTGTGGAKRTADQKKLTLEQRKAEMDAAREAEFNNIVSKGKTITDKLRSLKIDGDVAGVYIVPPVVFNAAIETVATAIDAGVTIGASVNKGIQYIRDTKEYKALTEQQQLQAEEEFTNTLKTILTDEKKNRKSEKLQEQGDAEKDDKTPQRKSKSKYGQRLLDSEELSGIAKAGLSDKYLNYATKTLVRTEADVEKMIADIGVEATLDAIYDLSSGMSPDVRVFAAQLLTKVFNDNKDYDAAINLANFTVQYGTSLGRAINAFKAWNNIDIQGIEYFYTAQINKARDKIIKQNKGYIDNIKAGIREGNTNAAKKVSKLSKSESEKIKALGLTEEQVNEGLRKANERFRKAMGTANLGIPPEAVAALTEIGYYLTLKGYVSFKKWAKQIRKETGLDLSDEQLRDIFENQPTQQGGKTLKELVDGEVIPKIVEDFYTTETEPTADKLSALIQDIGYTKEVADKLSNAIQKQFDKIAPKERESSVKSKIGSKITNLKGRKAAVEAAKKGDLRDKQLIEMLEDYLNLPKVDAATVEKVIALNEKRMAMPDGFMKDEVTVKMMAEMEKSIGVNIADVAMSIWYASILSGPKTQLLNGASNAITSLGEVYATTMYQLINERNPQFIFEGFRAWVRGINKGIPEFVGVVAGGTKRDDFKYENKNVLELIRFYGGRYNPANWLKYVGRSLSATDILFAEGLYELSATDLAYRQAISEGAKGEQLRKKVSEILSNGEQAWESAKLQAEEEVNQYLGTPKTKTERAKYRLYVTRRANEIVDQSRDGDLKEEAYTFAKEGTYNYQPRGVIGVVANNLNSLGNKLPPAKLYIPFTRVVANVMNESINYTPIGIARAGGFSLSNIINFIKRDTLIETTIRPDKAARYRTLYKSLLGTMSAIALYTLHLMYEDDEDPFFAIYGAGPPDPNKRGQWYAQGGRVYSIKIGSKTYSYQYTPMAIVLSAIAGWIEHDKYKKPSEGEEGSFTLMESTNRFTYALLAGGRTGFDMSFLTGVSGIFEALSPERASYINDNSANKLLEEVFKPTTAVVPAFVTQVGDIFDPTIYDTDGIMEQLIKRVPVVRSSYLKPKLNALGEPIQKESAPLLDRFYSPENQDPVWRYLAVNKLTIPAYGKPNLNGVKMTEDQHHEYVEIAGQYLKELLKENIPSMSDMTQAQKQEKIKWWSDDAKEYAKEKLMGE